MKHIVIRGVFVLLLFYAPRVIQAQKFIPADLQLRLEGKTKLADIMQVVDAYYDNGNRPDINVPLQESNAYVHWKRWEWWMSSHLDANGNFVKNFKQLNYDALNETDRKWSAEINKAIQDNQQGRAASLTALQREQQGPPIGGGEEPQNLAYGDWSFLGPTGDGAGPGDIKGKGRLDRIAFHPTDANTIYVGAPTGNLWKTTDGGSTWTSVTDGLVNPGIAGIAISPTNGNIIYILTGDGDSFSPGYLVYDYGSSRASMGVFKSTDGGVSWKQMGALYTGAGDYEGHRLTISPTNGNYLMATTSQGIYRTTDGGVTWIQVKTGEHWDVKFKPTTDSVVYATSGSAIFYSTQGGRSGTWLTSTTDIFSVASAGRIELGVSANNANYVYALCGDVTAAGVYTGIFRSTNSGVNYFRRSNTPNILGSEENGLDANDQSAYDLGIAVKPTDAEFIATCGLNVWVSSASNGGSAMVWSTKYREGYAGAANKYIHPDVHAVAYNPLNNNLYAATDGGFYRSTDDGVSWTNITNGIATSQLFSMSMRDADADGDGDGIGFLTGAQDNGMKFRQMSGSTLFDHLICCDGYGVGIHGRNPDTMYMNINDVFGRTLDGGATVSLLFNSTFFAPVAVDYNFPDTVYLGGSATRRTFNAFTTSANLAPSTNTRRVITTCPSNSAVIYGSAGTNVIRSGDRAATWATISGTAGWPAGTFTVNDIEAYPTNSGEVYVSFGGYSAGNKVMRTTNSGTSWTNWSGSLPNIPTYGLAVATEGVYVGTEFGVFFRSYTMTDWVPFYNGMPRAPVTEIAVNQNGFIYASTFGRGAWLGTRRSACAASLSISGSRNGPYYYEASDAVTATITAPGTHGDEIFVQAGNTVTMNPGFEIKIGSYFKAYLSPCSNGGVPAARGNEVLIPHLTEIKPQIKSPALSATYYTIADNKIEFNIAEKGKLEMMAKQTDGSWKPFYPEDIIYPGFYSIPGPNAFTGEIKLRLNGRDIQKL